jgi:flagellar M-ring protein FliF
MGGIKRLTVGVLVNYRRIVDEKTGKVTVKALTAAEVAQIDELVREAMGYSKERGDTLTVKNAPFDGVDKPNPPPDTLPWWKDAEIQRMLWTAARGLFFFALLAFLFFRVLRPMLRPVMRKLDEITEVPPLPVAAAADAPGGEVRTELQELESTQNQGYRENLQMAKTLAKDDPRVVANVVKAWVGANE